MADVSTERSGIDPYIFWLLGEGRRYYFLPGRQDEGLEWISVLLRLAKGITARDFAAGDHIGDPAKRRAWVSAVRVPSLYTDSRIGAGEGPYVTAIMRMSYLMKDFVEDPDLRLDLRRAIETVTPGLPLSRASWPPPESTTPPPPEEWRSEARRAKDSARLAPADTVVIGIIDDGIAFAHERFRKIVSGSIETRVEHWWLQDGPYKPNFFPFLPLGSQNVPSGCELDKAQIDDLLADCTRGGVVDEDLVYRKSHLIDFQVPGHKSAAGRVAHGTHVMDLACGFPPSPPRHNRPIIAVQLPIAVTADTSGGSLFPYVFEAMLYILDRATLIPGAANAPVVINLSYGRLEGPHDGTADIELAILLLVALAGGRLHVTLPAGNSFLSRTHAQVQFASANEVRALHWRVLPDDRTPSFVEIWLPRRGFGSGGSRLSVTITSPTGESHTIAEFGGPVSWGSAPVYAEAHFYFSLLTGRTMFRLSARPTTDLTPGAPLAPAGLWKIELTNTGLTGETVHAWVQRDDSLYGFPLRGRQSFFEDNDYVRFDLRGDDKETDDAESPVRRVSTLNAIATGADPYVAAGCLRKELVAAKYSSAGAVIPPLRWPTAIVASEDSRVHTGVMAAGARSGAIVAMGGTSVAAPQMARLLADSLVGGPALSFTPLAGVPAEREGAGLLATPIFRPKRYE
jgi:Subtilase family